MVSLGHALAAHRWPLHLTHHIADCNLDRHIPVRKLHNAGHQNKILLDKWGEVCFM